MSFIKVHQTDLRESLGNRNSVDIDVINAIDHALGKISASMGSLKLRRYKQEYLKIKGPSSWRVSDLIFVSNEINTLNGNTPTKIGKGFKNSTENTQGSPELKSNSMSLNNNVNDWLNRILSAVQKFGSVDVKRCIRTTDDVRSFLTLEGGLVNGRMVLNAKNGSFNGPLQLGVDAWIDGPMLFSPIKVSNSSASLRRIGSNRLRLATDNFERGGPGDLDVIDQGVVRFWNNCWKYFISAATKAGRSGQLQKIPRNAKMMYLLHNQGPSGALKIFTHDSPVDAGQSLLAIKVGRDVRQEFLA